MTKSNQDISNLLAFRDGDPVAADVKIDAQDLVAVEQLRDAIVDLPNVPVADEVWMQAPATPQTSNRKWLNYPLSTAASVLVLSAVIAFGVGSGTFTPQQHDPNVAVTVPDNPLLALMDRSQDLEQIAYDASAWQQRTVASNPTGLSVSPLGEFILYQLAQVDEAIEDASLDEELTAQLWQQRVNLLQAFLVEMESHNPGRFENNRSM